MGKTGSTAANHEGWLEVSSYDVGAPVAALAEEAPGPTIPEMNRERGRWTRRRPFRTPDHLVMCAKRSFHRRGDDPLVTPPVRSKELMLAKLSLIKLLRGLLVRTHAGLVAG
jgi:hypothetical protein